MTKKIMAFFVFSILFLSVAKAQSNDFWFNFVYAYFQNHCELEDTDELEDGETAYYITCIW